MKVETIQQGQVLHFVPEEMSFLVVMANDEGIRYIDPDNLEFDDSGNVITQYTPYETLSEWTICLGTMNDISAKLTGK